ncbi:DUF4190 domain-containing protein [Leucobacter sp. wl10]|uniref:DUF4190 domain-containing protein n=1 Tax=Leucobacter sp. wl10 TaxID=2304677 RepID=UPI000E5AEB62|nr:DUF4190 domain-containing protein [Leucobacter sp. wl10]RGE24281.1 DUF4190 domain-containing protein [Leucobacter sp. wl10]
MSENLPEGQSASNPVPPPPPAAPAAPAEPAYGAAPAQSKGLAIAALVLGIVSLVFCWIPAIGIIAGVVGLILGIIALRKRQSKGMSLTGIITGALGIVASIIILIVSIMIIGAAMNQLQNDPSLQDQLQQLEDAQ